MKKLALISAIVMGGLFYNTADAQIGVNLGFHLGSHRMYGPSANIVVQAPVYAESYNDDNDYYYLPDVGAYYDVAEQSYYYNDGGNWASAAYLPGYQDYDWRNARRYEVHASRPYLNDRFYSSRYGGHAGNFNRVDNRTYANRDFNRGDYRNGGQRFDNPGYRNMSGMQHEQQFNRGRDNFGQSSFENRGHNYGQTAHENHEQGNYGQPSNRGGQERGNNGGGQHFSGNRGQEGRGRF